MNLHKTLTLALALAAATSLSAKKKTTAYLFTYFTGNAPEEEQICYAISEDGWNYTPLNDGKPIIASKDIARTGCVRDPHILRGEDGWFYQVVTDMKSSLGWSSNRGMVLMRSRDLVNWEHHTVHFPERYRGTMFEHVTRVWAPQTIYDPRTKRYIVYFSILTDDGSCPYDRVYWAFANDDFSDLAGEPQLLFDMHNASIDTDIVRDEDTDKAVEGSGVFRLHDGTWVLMYDCYTSGHYQFCKSSDLKTFKRVQDTETKGAFTPRHGTVIAITSKELKRLQKAFPNTK